MKPVGWGWVHGLLTWFVVVTLYAAPEGGTILGSVSFRGTPPAAQLLEVTKDQVVCGKTRSWMPVHVNPANQGLQSAIVSVKALDSSLPSISKSTRLLSNTECRFSPHVSAAKVGDRLEVHNQDPILHNTHISRNKRTFLNVAQLPGSRPIPKTIKQIGEYGIRCDKHKFMGGVLKVFSHGYFMVTDALGTFELPPLPPGTYTLQVWHETLGELEKEVHVPASGTITVKFEYS